MNQRTGFKNMPKRQAKKFTKLKIKNAQQKVLKQATRLQGVRPRMKGVEWENPA